MIDTERKEDLFLDTKLIKSENRLGKLRIIDELHPVLGGQPTHEADQPNDNNPFLDLACTMQFTIDKVNEVDKKADTKLAKAQNLKDVANVAIARDNLGLGTSSTMNATSTLSDRTDQTATIKAVNDVNRDVVTAQKTANTANDKANAAQTRADSAYNLADRKRDLNNSIFDARDVGEKVILKATSDGISMFLDTSTFARGLYHYRAGEAREYYLDLPDKNGTLAIDSQIVGVNQSWKDVKTQRSIDVEYANNSEKAIVVVAHLSGLEKPSAKFTVGGVFGGYGHSPAAGVTTSFSIYTFVPAKSRYKLEVSSGRDIQIREWAELR